MAGDLILEPRDAAAYGLGMLDAGKDHEEVVNTLRHHGLTVWIEREAPEYTAHVDSGMSEEALKPGRNGFVWECTDAAPRRALRLALSCVFLTDAQLAEEQAQ